MIKWASLFFSILFFSQCRKIETVINNNEVVSYLSFVKPLSPFVEDKNTDFFLDNSWYVYDEANHIIWPNFRVFGLKKDQSYYKFQIIDYYNQDSMPGYYSLRFYKKDVGEKEIFVAAPACGNVFTNPQYLECSKDPEKNIFTYLNIDNSKTWIMTEFEASIRDDWDIAFRGTEVILNSGIHGPGSVRIADLFLNKNYYRNGNVDYQGIAQESFGAKGRLFFDISFPLERAPYALPAGRDRVIFEEDWYQNRRGTHIPKSDNWWLVKDHSGQHIIPFSVKDIEDIKLDGSIETSITFDLGRFGVWTIGPFSSAERLIKLCLNLLDKEIVNCNSEQTDMIFSALNRGSRRSWRFNVIHSAVGPLKYSELSDFGL